MTVDLPPVIQERLVCSLSAAAKYGIPANILLAVAEKENGAPGQWVRNRNGSHDVGQLQFNTEYLRSLARYRITPADVAAVGCYAYDLAAWRLRQHITKDVGDLWTRCANYHSRTARFNNAYRAGLMHRAARWADWLTARFQTHDILSVEVAPRAPSLTSGVEVRVMTSKPKLESARLNSAAYVPRKLLSNERP